MGKKKKISAETWQRDWAAIKPPRYPVIWRRKCLAEGIILLAIRYDIDKPTEWVWQIRVLEPAGKWGKILRGGKVRCFEHANRTADAALAARVWELPEEQLVSEPEEEHAEGLQGTGG
jgi:hypothetical protein